MIEIIEVSMDNIAEIIIYILSDKIFDIRANILKLYVLLCKKLMLCLI
jgi:hypothetical protein